MQKHFFRKELHSMVAHGTFLCGQWQCRCCLPSHPPAQTTPPRAAGAAAVPAAAAPLSDSASCPVASRLPVLPPHSQVEEQQHPAEGIQLPSLGTLNCTAGAPLNSPTLLTSFFAVASRTKGRLTRQHENAARCLQPPVFSDLPKELARKEAQW